MAVQVAVLGHASSHEKKINREPTPELLERGIQNASYALLAQQACSNTTIDNICLRHQSNNKTMEQMPCPIFVYNPVQWLPLYIPAKNPSAVHSPCRV